MATTHTPMTAAQFDLLPDEPGRRYELLDGEVIEMASATPEHSRIVARVLLSLSTFLDSNEGGAVLPGVEFAIGSALRLRPDLAVLPGSKWASLDRRKVPVCIAPDVAIEVISPSEPAFHVDRKIKAYLEGGVSEVIVIYPDTRHIYVVSKSGAAHYWSGDLLISAVLSGWSIPVERVFE